MVENNFNIEQVEQPTVADQQNDSPIVNEALDGLEDLSTGEPQTGDPTELLFSSPYDQNSDAANNPDAKKNLKKLTELVQSDKKKASDFFLNGPGMSTENLRPKNGVYNPAAPPGLDHVAKPGESFDSEREGGGDNYDIEFRKKTRTARYENSKRYEYDGEVDDGYLENTPFSASEVLSPDGKILERDVSYGYLAGKGLDMSLNDGKGGKLDLNVKRIHTRFNGKTGLYESSIRTSNNVYYKAVLGNDGKVLSLKRDRTR